MNRTRRGGAKTKGEHAYVNPLDYANGFRAGPHADDAHVDIAVFRPFLKPLRGVKQMKLMVERAPNGKKILLIGEIHHVPKCNGFTEIRIGDALRNATEEEKLDFMIEVPDDYGRYSKTRKIHFRENHSDYNALNRLRHRLSLYLPNYRKDKRRLKSFPHARVHWLELGGYNLFERGQLFEPWFQDLYNFVEGSTDFFVTTEGDTVHYGDLIQLLFQCTKAPRYQAKLNEFMQYIVLPDIDDFDKQSYLLKSLLELLPQTKPGPIYWLGYNLMERLRHVHKFASPKCGGFNVSMFAGVWFEIEGDRRLDWSHPASLGKYMFDFQRFTVDVYTYCRIMQPITEDGYLKNIVIYAGAFHTTNVFKMLHRSGFGERKQAVDGIPFNPLCN